MKPHQLPEEEFRKYLAKLRDAVIDFNNPRRMENLIYKYRADGIVFPKPTNPRMRRRK